MDAERLGKLLREAREERGMTLSDVEQITSIGSSHLSRIERGIHACGLRTLGRLAKLYGLTVEIAKS